uniref:UDP-N-acetylmuramoyl-tripeptide--D-alanyl-D-alanine ligase n=1 Tax=Candidatus Kentrum sp. SD TaxID=2126332 RepID=A0A450YLQ6_9GAMM|nr:MAG: UDP-N-acetylmuramoyl-tripeptide--D-alanyl-D-alanine ligase [Candidatus Kentron sp. SD]VFK42494.1 MAG: UDP-N-acetylmuramoyl-tripeptide--D-alanyl-D-alanine ligase [Candidatus Kentron sp. SD]
MIDAFLAYALFPAFGFFAYRRLLTYLRYLQQEEYDGKRFLAWLWHARAVDKRLSVMLVIVASSAAAWPGPWWAALVGIAMLSVVWRQDDPRRKGKKPLVMTARAKRILGVAWGIALLMGVLPISASHMALWLLPVHILPLTLIVGVLLWAPHEKYLQQRYWQEARHKIQDAKPFIIGVTGSFGKTSVKHILGHILETSAPTLWTPGSVNTPMGNTRVIRERLTPGHKYFIVEMGAYGPGSIETLCRLTPPDMAIITAIGSAHYERFKSLDTVAEAKFELAEAVIADKPEGLVVTHQGVLDFQKTKTFAEQHPDNMILCGRNEMAHLRIEHATQTPQGLRIDVRWARKAYHLAAPLYGLHHAENIALAFATACSLGIKPETVIVSLKTVPQITHRLECKPQPNGSILIDDAFNANTKGFASALELLDLLGKHQKGRRILITPGIVELGAAHDAEHKKLAELALATTDIVLPIVPERIAGFVDTYRQGISGEQRIILRANFAQAQAWLTDNIRSNDVVLLENDLPDLYETKPVL